MQKMVRKSDDFLGAVKWIYILKYMVIVPTLIA